MQNTQSAGQPGSTTVVPALPDFLDSKNDIANPSPSDKLGDEAHSSGGPKDVKHEFTNSASGRGGDSASYAVVGES